jgi:hypothetical protein
LGENFGRQMAVSVVPQNCVIDLRCSTPADSTKYLQGGPHFMAHHEQMEYNEYYFDEVSGKSIFSLICNNRNPRIAVVDLIIEYFDVFYIYKISQLKCH